MDCGEARELIPDDISGNLPDAGPLEGHLAGCASCRAECDEARRAWEALGALPELELSASFAQGTRALLRESMPARRSRARSWGWRAAGWGLAALGGFALAQLVRRPPEPTAPTVLVEPQPRRAP